MGRFIVFVTSLFIVNQAFTNDQLPLTQKCAEWINNIGAFGAAIKMNKSGAVTPDVGYKQQPSQKGILIVEDKTASPPAELDAKPMQKADRYPISVEVTPYPSEGMVQFAAVLNDGSKEIVNMVASGGQCYPATHTIFFKGKTYLKRSAEICRALFKKVTGPLYKCLTQSAVLNPKEVLTIETCVGKDKEALEKIGQMGVDAEAEFNKNSKLPPEQVKVGDKTLVVIDVNEPTGTQGKSLLERAQIYYRGCIGHQSPYEDHIYNISPDTFADAKPYMMPSASAGASSSIFQKINVKRHIEGGHKK